MTEPTQPEVDRYRDALVALLPPGQALLAFFDELLTGVLEAIAVEYARVEGRGVDIRLEAVPSLAVELLPDWERVLGLSAGSLTIPQRQSAVAAKLGSTLGISEANYVELAARIGHDVTVSYFRPFQPGISCAGDLVCTDEYQFVWLVTTNTRGPVLDALLRATLEAYAPPHTLVLFEFVSVPIPLLIGGRRLLLGGPELLV